MEILTKVIVEPKVLRISSEFCSDSQLLDKQPESYRTTCETFRASISCFMIFHIWRIPLIQTISCDTHDTCYMTEVNREICSGEITQKSSTALMLLKYTNENFITPS